MNNPGRFTSHDLSWYAQRASYTTSHSSSSHYILLLDDTTTPLKIARYLAISDDQGLTGKTREDFIRVLSELAVGSKAKVVIKSCGYRNQAYDHSFLVAKVTQDDWVLQD